MSWAAPVAAATAMIILAIRSASAGIGVPDIVVIVLAGSTAGTVVGGIRYRRYRFVLSEDGVMLPSRTGTPTLPLSEIAGVSFTRDLVGRSVVVFSGQSGASWTFKNIANWRQVREVARCLALPVD